MLSRSMVAVTIIGLTACSAEPVDVLTGPGAASYARSGDAPVAIEAFGDMEPLTATSGASVLVAVNQKAPFRNLTLSAVRVTLVTPTAPEAACKLAGSTRTYSDSFGNNAGVWQGDLVIWQGKTTKQSNFKFSGTRVVNGIEETVQFTANDDDAVQSSSGSTVSLALDAARFGFGSQSTHYDIDAAGLPILRCVHVTFTATSNP